MRCALLIGPILLLLACDSGEGAKNSPEPKGKSGAASLDELRERAVKAIRADDVEAYLELVASPAFLIKNCPEEPDYAALAEGGEVAARGQQRIAVGSAMVECADAFDWAAATVERVEGGEPKKRAALSCSPAAEAYEDLITYYKVGGKTWRIKAANDVYKIAGRYVVLDTPLCERRDP